MKKTIQPFENTNQVVDLFPNLSEYPTDDAVDIQLEKEADTDALDSFKNKKTIKIDQEHSWKEKKIGGK